MPDLDFMCGITGEFADDDAYITDTGPIGWVRVTLERDVPNPEYQAIQAFKRSMVEQQYAQVADQIPEGDEMAAAQTRRGVEIQVDAAFAALEAETDEFLTQSEVAYISPPEQDEDVNKTLNDIRESLGITNNFDFDDEDDDEDEDDESNDGEEGE